MEVFWLVVVLEVDDLDVVDPRSHASALAEDGVGDPDLEVGSSGMLSMIGSAKFCKKGLGGGGSILLQSVSGEVSYSSSAVANQL